MDRRRGSAVIRKRACAIAFTVIAAACGSSNTTPTEPSPPSTSPAPTPPAPSTPAFSGVEYDNISAPHQFIVGSPVQTQNQTGTYCCWPLPVHNEGVFTFDEAAFPLNMLPSGGSSNIISASEMILVGLNEGSTTGSTTLEWHRAVGQDVVVYSYTASGSYSWLYSFIGHFSWEISPPGSYYMLVSTPTGNARLDFLVTNSTSSELRIDSNQRAVRFGGGGGSGHAVRLTGTHLGTTP